MTRRVPGNRLVVCILVFDCCNSLRKERSMWRAWYFLHQAQIRAEYFSLRKYLMYVISSQRRVCFNRACERIWYGMRKQEDTCNTRGVYDARNAKLLFYWWTCIHTEWRCLYGVWCCMEYAEFITLTHLSLINSERGETLYLASLFVQTHLNLSQTLSARTISASLHTSKMLWSIKRVSSCDQSV